MSSKENAAMFQLFDLLESRYALRTLWVLRDHRPQTFRLLQDSLGGVTPNTLNTRLKALREAGWIEHGKQGYRLTAAGIDLVKRVSDLHAFAGRWANGRAAAGAAAPAAGALPAESAA
ncbi:MAG: winged helix-turn-helix transcriptional regulator [Xylophilus ampelinus]